MIAEIKSGSVRHRGRGGRDLRNTEAGRRRRRLTFVFLIAKHEQFQPLGAGDERELERSAVALGQALGRDVPVKGVAVGAVENDPALELLSQERLEQLKDHVEYVRLVDYVDVLHPQRHAFLQQSPSL